MTPADVAAISDVAGPAADFDNLSSEAAVVGATVTEFGATFAFEAEINRRRLSFGITPKAQWIEMSNFATGVTSFDDGDALEDFRDKEFRSAFNDINLDVGLAYQLEYGVTVGVAALNLLRNSYDTRIASGRQYTYWIEPRPTAGVALEEAGFTFTADLDLIKTTRFKDAGDSQLIRMGLSTTRSAGASCERASATTFRTRSRTCSRSDWGSPGSGREPSISSARSEITRSGPVSRRPGASSLGAKEHPRRPTAGAGKRSGRRRR